jgi:carboxymethylenebutenolidase
VEESAVSWDSQRTDAEVGMVAMNTKITGGNGETIHAYVAKPDGAGPYPGVVITFHAPGYDEWTREFARRFADHGYITVVPNLYERFGHGTPAEAAAAARAAGGVTDASVIADSEAALKYIQAMPNHNGKVGVIGPCSGGRHAVLVASSVPGFDAVVDLWGGGVVQAETTPQRPVAPIDLTANLNAPILGIFGNDDRGPSPEQVNQHEEALKAAGKTYQFHRYDGAGHGIFYYHNPMSYRPQAAMDGWDHVFAWFDKYLKGTM